MLRVSEKYEEAKVKAKLCGWGKKRGRATRAQPAELDAQTTVTLVTARVGLALPLANYSVSGTQFTRTRLAQDAKKLAEHRTHKNITRRSCTCLSSFEEWEVVPLWREGC